MSPPLNAQEIYYKVYGETAPIADTRNTEIHPFFYLCTRFIPCVMFSNASWLDPYLLARYVPDIKDHRNNVKIIYDVVCAHKSNYVSREYPRYMIGKKRLEERNKLCNDYNLDLNVLNELAKPFDIFCDELVYALLFRIHRETTLSQSSTYFYITDFMQLYIKTFVSNEYMFDDMERIILARAIAELPPLADYGKYCGPALTIWPSLNDYKQTAEYNFSDLFTNVSCNHVSLSRKWYTTGVYEAQRPFSIFELLVDYKQISETLLIPNVVVIGSAHCDKDQKPFTPLHYHLLHETPDKLKYAKMFASYSPFELHGVFKINADTLGITELIVEYGYYIEKYDDEGMVINHINLNKQIAQNFILIAKRWKVVQLERAPFKSSKSMFGLVANKIISSGTLRPRD